MTDVAFDVDAFMDDQTLAHHGVLGQKWGVRHDPQSGQTVKMTGKEKDAEIRAARDRQASRELKTENKYIAKRNDLHETYKKGKAAADAVYSKAYDKNLSHPDSTTSARYTRGEKAATALFISGAVLGTVSYVALLAGK